MHPTTQPEAHELYHERQYPPYSPQPPQPEAFPLRTGPIPLLVLVMLAILGAWGLARLDHSPHQVSMQAVQSPSVEFQPSEAALVLGQESPAATDESREPLHPSAAEQQLTRSLAELDAEMDHTGRLAERLGQDDAYAALQSKHEQLSAAVAARSVPWSEEDRIRLERQTQSLRQDVAQFSRELEEVAAVRL
jgi:hypothetical protein